MFILGYFLKATAMTLSIVFNAFLFIVILSALLTWFNPDPYHPVVRFIWGLTEPIFRMIRKRIPLIFSGLDFTPVVVIIIIYFLKGFLVPVLLQGANMLIK